jgi:hypothetical protein
MQTLHYNLLEFGQIDTHAKTYSNTIKIGSLRSPAQLSKAKHSKDTQSEQQLNNVKQRQANKSKTQQSIVEHV